MMTLDDAYSDVSKELQILGDPSGRQDSQYWDEWFDVVCRKQNHRSFEWYCTPDEVLRVLQENFGNQQRCSGFTSVPLVHDEYAMIHPGSGTSVLPIVLSITFPTSRQVVVDVSKVAITEMQHIHDKVDPQKNATVQSGKIPLRPIEYVVADLLREDTDTDSTEFPESTFDCWIDKGFLDAVFSDKYEARNALQSKRLFQEANRILKHTTGFMMMITLAEEHSLQIIVENWLSSNDWQPLLNIWQLQPTSGDKPPFAFVLTKEGKDRRPVDNRFILNFFPGNNENPIHSCLSGSDAIIERIGEIIFASTQQFSLSQLEKRTVQSTIPKLLATIEIKVFDAETDLMALGETILKIEWNVIGTDRIIHVQWQPFTRNEERSESCRIVPIGYGISKLQLLCVVGNDDLDELVASIEEWDTDVIQSVDIDWSQTGPIRNIDDIMRTHCK